MKEKGYRLDRTAFSAMSLQEADNAMNDCRSYSWKKILAGYPLPANNRPTTNNKQPATNNQQPSVSVKTAINRLLISL